MEARGHRLRFDVVMTTSARLVTGCAAKRRWSAAGVYPPGNWFAPPGSNQSCRLENPGVQIRTC